MPKKLVYPFNLIIRSYLNNFAVSAEMKSCNNGLGI